MERSGVDAGGAGPGSAANLSDQRLVRAGTAAEVAELVREHARVVVRGGGTKPRLSRAPAGAACIDVSAMAGVVRYDPGEFTFTAQAGTSLLEVIEMLARRNQYLPFDPPLAGAGATLGGTVAAGLSGSGRFRYGGVRDFLIGIRFVDGRGEIVRGGGAVVKNAAGFDLPKLMVGALGRLGVLTEVTFKVFPAPRAFASARAVFASMGEAVDAMVDLAGSRFDLDALDIVPREQGSVLWLRVAGPEPVLRARLERIRDRLASGHRLLEFEAYGIEASGARGVGDGVDHWREMSDFGWRPVDQTLVKVAVTPERSTRLDPELAARGACRRYAGGGAIGWIAWPGATDELDALLRSQQLAGVCLDGDSVRPWLGALPGRAFLERVSASLDPFGRFGALVDHPG
jgi:glycolate oxidase FAD binding subunit